MLARDFNDHKEIKEFQVTALQAPNIKSWTL